MGMTTVVADDVGKYLQLGQDCHKHDTFTGEYLLVFEHQTYKGRASNDRTDVGIFADEAM